MKKFFFCSILIGLVSLLGCQSKKTGQSENQTQVEMPQVKSRPSSVYELRTYYAPQGKLGNLLSRFRDHTVRFFEKYGMENIGYWTPIENEENTLTYILGYPDREEQKTSWAAFREDQDWLKAKEASELNGKLVDSVKSSFIGLSSFSPELILGDSGPRVFEMRTYYTNPGRLGDLHARFRDATMGFFEKHGMTNVAYFSLNDDQPGAENTLFYIITHPDRETAKDNWTAFIDDPEWKSVYEASIADGRLVDSITSSYMASVDFSPLK